MSQEDLAEKADISYSTLAKIEQGKIKNPSIFSVTQIAGALNMSIDELLQYRPARSIHNKTEETSFIYFDVHGVITTNWSQIFTELAARFHLEPQDVELGFWRYNDIVGRGHMSIDEFETALARNLRLKVKRLPYREVYFEIVQGNPKVHAMMSQLNERYKIGLLTNIFPGFLDKLIEMGAVPDLPYAARIESCEVGAVKPELPIFEYAALQTNVATNRILMVDDTRANLDAAEHLGWRSFWFDEQHPNRSLGALSHQLLAPQP